MGDSTKIKTISLGLAMMKQEMEEGNYKFDGKFGMSAQFKNEFGDHAESIALTALNMVKREYPDHADYLQVFFYNDVKIYMIDSVEYFTIMLASDY